jgi:hypothetical protein
MFKFNGVQGIGMGLSLKNAVIEPMKILDFSKKTTQDAC